MHDRGGGTESSSRAPPRRTRWTRSSTPRAIAPTSTSPRRSSAPEQCRAEEQPDTETDCGGKAHHNQIAPANLVWQVQAGRERGRCRDEYACRLAADDRDRQSPGSRLQGVKGHTCVHESEEEQRYLRGISPPELELTQGITVCGACVDKESRIARGVGQEWHDRNESEGWMDAAPNSAYQEILPAAST